MNLSLWFIRAFGYIAITYQLAITNHLSDYLKPIIYAGLHYVSHFCLGFGIGDNAWSPLPLFCSTPYLCNKRITFTPLDLGG